MASFVIVTTRDLPEAYFLAAALERRRQRIAVINITGRPLGAKFRVLRRLRQRRGTPYLADLLLGRALRRRYLPARVLPFPEIDAGFVAAIKRRTSMHTCADPHRPETLRFVRDFDPDYMLLAGTPILEPTLFTLARHGALNRHLGVLPEYRGSDCPLWALALDDPEHLGFSIHRVSERVDRGDVLHVEPVPIAPGESLVRYLARFQRRASHALIGLLDRLIEGAPVHARPQVAGGRYFPPAGFRTLRLARRNFDRVAKDLLDRAACAPPVAPRPAMEA
jgi:folate-dependent phosphoribosylglycinamide formyltransferase PurN